MPTHPRVAGGAACLAPDEGEALSRPAARGVIAMTSRSLLVPTLGEEMPRLQHGEDGIEHRIQILHDVAIPEPEDAVAACYQKGVAHLVVLAFGVLASVELDDQLALAADEVREIWTDRLLAHELVSGELAIVQAIPEPSFSVGLRAAKMARIGGLPLVRSAHDQSRMAGALPLPACGERASQPSSAARRARRAKVRGCRRDGSTVDSPSPARPPAESASPRKRGEVFASLAFAVLGLFAPRMINLEWQVLYLSPLAGRGPRSPRRLRGEPEGRR